MSKPAHTPRVTQEVLGEILRLKGQYASAMEDVTRLKDEITYFETLVIDLLAKGSIPERGPIKAFLHQYLIRRPHWKTLYAKVEGPAAVVKAINATPPLTVTKLIVDEDKESE